MTFRSGFGPVFRPVFDPGLTARNGLLNALIAYWPGNEASGNLLDAHTNALHLTDTNTVTNAAGKVYATARQYTQANNEYHTRASQALLETGNVDFTFAAWVWLDALSTNERWVVRKGPPWEWYLNCTPSTNKMRFVIRNAEVVYSAAITDSAWYLVFGWHDATNGRIGVSTNLSSGDAARTTAPTAGAGAFAIGSGAGSTINWNGRIGPSMFWKSAAGGGGVLSAAQRTALWANGNGLAYAQFTT